MKHLEDLKLENQNILLLVDFNVAINNDEVESSFKIDQAIPTLQYLINSNCNNLTITSHLGRPQNRNEYSILPIFKYLKTIFARIEMVKIESILEAGNNQMTFKMHSIYLTDNNRYYNKDEMTKLATKYDIIVNDAFGCAHRNSYFRAYAGFLIRDEIMNLREIQNDDLLIIGGAKALDKLSIVERLNCTVFLGGCLALSVLYNFGYEIGQRTRHDRYNCTELLGRVYVGDTERTLLGKKDKDRLFGKNEEGLRVVLPLDYFVRDHSEAGKPLKIRKYNEIQNNDECVDLGPESLDKLSELIKNRPCVYWNGPLGRIEKDGCSGTEKLVSILKNYEGNIYIGGGETALAITKSGLGQKKTVYVSTGGGAMLQLISGGVMPGKENLI